MAIYRSKVGDSHIFKKHPWNYQLFYRALGTTNTLYYRITNSCFFQGIIDTFLQIKVFISRSDIIQIFGDTTHIL